MDQVVAIALRLTWLSCSFLLSYTSLSYSKTPSIGLKGHPKVRSSSKEWVTNLLLSNTVVEAIRIRGCR